MRGWTAITRHGVTRKRGTKNIQYLFWITSQSELYFKFRRFIVLKWELWVLWVGSSWNWWTYIPHRKYLVKPFSTVCAAIIVHRNNLFHFYQNDKSQSKLKFKQISNLCKRIPEAAKFAYINKTEESITFQKLGSWGFWRIYSAIPPLFNGPEVSEA